MDQLKVIAIIGFVIVLSVVLYIGHSMLRDYRKSMVNNVSNRKIRTILDIHEKVVAQSNYRDELRSTIAENYVYILNLLHRRRDPDINTPTTHIDLGNHPILRDEILPYLSSQVYHDLEPLDKTLLRLIDYYNNEMEELMSIFELLVLVVKTTPPSMYGHDKRIMDQIYY